MEIKLIKLHPAATMPTKAHETDAAYDLYSVEDCVVEAGTSRLVKTGIGIELPIGYYAEILSRSGLALEDNVFVLNAPGIIDAGFQDGIGVILANFNPVTFDGRYDFWFSAGYRIAQMIIKRVEPVELAWADDFASKSARGKGGFGSTGGYGGDSTVIGLDLTT